MRVKQFTSLALASTLMVGIFSLSNGWAAGLILKHRAHKPVPTVQTDKTDKAAIAPATDTTSPLGEIRSFDVMDIENQNFSASRDAVPAEIMEYARAALQNDERLRYGSPAQGLLRFSCANKSCSRIRAEVTQGNNGPVVWQTEALFEPSVFVNVHFLPDSKLFARRIVGKLAMDYQKALKPLPMKINIKDE